MGDLRELYQEVILDHSRKPRNFRELEGATGKAEGYNPLCGDKVTIFVVMEGNQVVDISFQGNGCAISTASASVMTQRLKGKTTDEVEAVFKSFHGMVTGQPAEVTDSTPEIGKLAIFKGVREFPIRVKCATLAWHTLRAAMAGKSATVSTE